MNLYIYCTHTVHGFVYRNIIILIIIYILIDKFSSVFGLVCWLNKPAKKIEYNMKEGYE